MMIRMLNFLTFVAFLQQSCLGDSSPWHVSPRPEEPVSLSFGKRDRSPGLMRGEQSRAREGAWRLRRSVTG